MYSILHKAVHVDQEKKSDSVDANMAVRVLDEEQGDILSLSGDQRQGRWPTGIQYVFKQ
jgi:hypothetical protein